MFLHQKLGYETAFLYTPAEMIERFHQDHPNYIGYDTETTGLNIVADTPFLYAVGWDKVVYAFEPTDEMMQAFLLLTGKANRTFAHNALFDYCMTRNLGCEFPKTAMLADSMTVARLTKYSDDPSGLSLETLGKAYVDASAKSAGDVIKARVNSINAVRRAKLREYLKGLYPKKHVQVRGLYDKRVAFIETEYDELFKELDERFPKANYKDVYEQHRDLMINYAYDDVVIMLEYLKKALPILAVVDEGLKIFTQECKLVTQVGNMVRVGLKADVQYLLDGLERVQTYRDEQYSMLHELVGCELTVYQHERIKSIMLSKFDLHLESTGKEVLKKALNYASEEAKKVLLIIMHLRTVDKWIGTYIIGMLNRVTNGRIHPSVSNSGTVTGRVSSDFQQQPKNGLYSTTEFDEDGNPVELFHPRRVIIADEGYSMFYFDYSQMEMRLQAQYTIWVSGGDVSLCRAFIPFKCVSAFTGEIFDHTDKEHLSKWNSGEWLDEEFNTWEPTDLHSATAHSAFPDIPMDSPEFKKARSQGKTVNFAKNYGAGVYRIQDSLDIDLELAQRLSDAYYDAFPKIKEYQSWVTKKLYKYGWVQNIFGRRYYMLNSREFYKAGNYLVQGGCADLMKRKQIEIEEFLFRNNLKSEMILPVHDEAQLRIPHGEEWITPHIKAILEDTFDYMENIPMICDIEYTKTNWADKEDYHE